MKKINLFFIVLLMTVYTTIQAQDSLQDKLNKKQYREIVREYEESSFTGQRDFNTLYITGQAYEGLLKYRQAYEIYQHCFNIDSLNTDLTNTLGRTATNLGKARDAKNYFKRVLENDSTNFYANLQLARLYFQLGEYDEAIDKYHEMEEEDPDNPAILKNLGDCYTRIDDWLTGSAYYYMAFLNNKENAGVASTVINTYLRMGGDNIPTALEVCDTALYYNPENKILQSNKAMTLYMSKKYAEADTLFTRLTQQGDSSFVTLLYGGASRYYAGYPMNAIEMLEAAYEMDDTSVDACLLLGAALGKTYDRKRAYELFDQAEANMQPSQGMVNRLHQFRGETYQRDGNYKEATRLFYLLWQENNERMDLLHKLTTINTKSKIVEYKSEEEKQRGLFFIILYTKQFLKTGEDPKHLGWQRNLLKHFYEEMFFNSAKEYTMLAPDGKKSKITMEEIKELMDQIPEMRR